MGGGAGASCGTFGKVCTAAGACACSGNGGTAQATEASCSDGFDNDCDGTVDCADTNCANQACTLSLGGGLSTAGTCNATSKACTCTPVAETGALCGDGKDNDCDGFVDCADTNCQPVGNALGQPCDANGNRCSPVAGGVSACNVCAPGGDPINAQAPGAETKCGDNLDNDCDGKADCQDANCATNALTCDNTGKACTAALLCRCPDASGTETVCDDGLDNDCDGKVDCQDTQCQPSGGIPGRTCGANGKICSATGGGTCVCSGNGGVAQATETSCTDGFDNDCDGLADCADPDCRPAAGSTFGAACTTATLVANAKCDASGQCVCTGGQASENTCSDGADNDCDGYPDCLDLNCNGKTCGVNGRLCATSANGTGSCVCPATPGSDGTTEVCNDGLDNNCDGKVDCADTACQATLAQCNPANSAYKCTNVGTGTPNWVCKDTSAFVLTVTPASNRVAANGIATTALTVKLLDTTTGTALPKAGATVTLSTTLGTVTPSVVTDAGGLNSLGVFTGSVTAGAATITATYAGTATVTATTTVNLPALSAISLAAQDFQVMGARDSGYQELNELTFLLTDANGQSYPAGLQVDFEHTPTGGSFIEVTGQAQSCTPSLCTTHGFTDASGKVRVLLHSGSVAGTVAVTAKASAGGTGLKQVTAGNIAIVGAKANGNEFTITCSPQNVPALISQDCTNSSYFGADATVSCRVVINDRYKNKLGVPALVQFFSEAGAMGSSATTPAYDPSKTPGQQTALGTATGIYVASGAKLPEDVAPQPGEYAYPHNWDGCAVAGTRVHNPRDGLVTVIATAQGEEGFFDGSNSCPANGLYDPPGSAGCALGERFVDLPEPFVDINDNGVRDAIAAGGEFDEPYFDANNNGQWDGPNGARDASTTIWAETRILYTGYAEVRFEGAQAASRVYNAFPVPFTPTPTADASFVVFHSTSTPPPARAATSQSVGVYVTDLNFNLPNYKSSYTLSKSGGIKADVISLPTSADGLGMLFRQLYCDGTNPAADCLATCSYNQCVRKADVGSFQYGSFGAFTVTGGTAPESACAWITASLKTTNTISGISTDRLIDIPVCGVALTPP